MADFKVDKNIPPPTRKAKYPFAEMQVGDSFFVPDMTTRSLQNAASYYRKTLNYKFESKAREENGVKGARIWRTA